MKRLSVGLLGLACATPSIAQEYQLLNPRIETEFVSAQPPSALLAPVPASQPTYSAPTPALHSAAAALPAAPCAEIQPVNLDHCDDCVNFRFPIVIHHRPHPNCQGGVTPGKELPVEFTPGDFERVPGTVLGYYDFEISFHGPTKVPVIQQNGEYQLVFKKLRFSKDCCDIEVCVPCRHDLHVTGGVCRADTRVVQLVARRVRKTGAIDIYAVNVPGMPKEYLIHRNLTLAAAHAEFPGSNIRFN